MTDQTTGFLNAAKGTPELITEAMLDKAMKAYAGALFDGQPSKTGMYAALLAVQDDMTRPVYNILRGWKRDCQRYEKGLKDVRAYIQATEFSGHPVQEMCDAILSCEDMK